MTVTSFNYYQREILLAMQRKIPNIYGVNSDPVAPAVVAKRRAKNKAARIARRASR